MAGRPPIDQFDAESKDIEVYLERLQEYCTAYYTKTMLLNDERFYGHQLDAIALAY